MGSDPFVSFRVQGGSHSSTPCCLIQAWRGGRPMTAPTGECKPEARGVEDAAPYGVSEP